MALILDCNDWRLLQQATVEAGHLLIEIGIVQIVLEVLLSLGAHAATASGIIDELIDGCGQRGLVAWRHEQTVHIVLDILGLGSVVAADVGTASHHILQIADTQCLGLNGRQYTEISLPQVLQDVVPEA